MERIITIRGSATYFMPFAMAVPIVIPLLNKKTDVSTTEIIVWLLIILWLLFWAIVEQLLNRRTVEIDQANNAVAVKTSFLWYAKVVIHKLSDFTLVASYIADGKMTYNFVALLTSDNRGLQILRVFPESEVVEPQKSFRMTERKIVESSRAKSLRMELCESLGLKDGGFQTKRVLFREM